MSRQTKLTELQHFVLHSKPVQAVLPSTHEETYRVMAWNSGGDSRVPDERDSYDSDDDDDALDYAPARYPYEDEWQKHVQDLNKVLDVAHGRDVDNKQAERNDLVQDGRRLTRGPAEVSKRWRFLWDEVMKGHMQLVMLTIRDEPSAMLENFRAAERIGRNIVYAQARLSAVNRIMDEKRREFPQMPKRAREDAENFSVDRDVLRDRGLRL